MRPASIKLAGVFSLLAFSLLTAIGPAPANAGELGLKAGPLTQPGAAFGKRTSPYPESAPVPSGSKTNDALLTTKHGKKKVHAPLKKKGEETPENRKND